jgi:hypothetical protein
MTEILALQEMEAEEPGAAAAVMGWSYLGTPLR